MSLTEAASSTSSKIVRRNWLSATAERFIGATPEGQFIVSRSSTAPMERLVSTDVDVE
jgi:hypothetical protein